MPRSLQKHALIPLRANLGEQLATFQHPSSISAPARIADVTPIASYSCVLSRTGPKMIVPGSPNVWTNNIPCLVKSDRRTKALGKKETLLWAFASSLPLFIAIDVIHEGNFKYDTIDVITERNSLRKLLRWVTNSDTEPFRIDVLLVGNACIFTKVKTADHSRRSAGYGLGFEEATTHPAAGCEEAAAHHRIISYNFGGLNVLLRFEVDACLDTNDGAASNNLIPALSQLSIGDSVSKTQRATGSVIHGLSVEAQSSRELVPQSSLIEIKTRSLKSKVRWDETFRQLYLSQTEWLYVGRHADGLFNDVTKERLNGEASANMERRKHAAETNEMAKLKALLDEILREARKVGEGISLTLLRDGPTLTLYRKQEQGETIPDQIMRKFRT